MMLEQMGLGLGIFVWVFLLVLAILWFCLPFAIFGTKAKLDELIKETKQTRILLAKVLDNQAKANRVADQSSDSSVLPPSSNASDLRSEDVVDKEKSRFSNASAASLAKALETAVLMKDVDEVEALMKAGANPNIKNEQGVSPLDMAINTENQRMIDLMRQA